MGTEQGDPPLATVRYLPVRTTPAEDVVDGELVDDEDDQLTSQRAQAMERYRGYRQDVQTAGRLVARAVRVTPVPDLRRVPGAIWAGHAVWARRISDRANHSLIRREIDAARMTGDAVAIAAWTDRLVAAQHRRWEGIQHAPQTVLALLKAAGLIIAVLLVVLAGIGGVCAVYHPLGVGWSDWWGLISTGINLAATLAVIAVNIALWGTVPAWLIAAYRAGRTQAVAPSWVVPAGHEGVDGRAILPTADMILSALAHLGIPALDKAFKKGFGTAKWPLQIFEGPVVADGLGYMARIRLPQGCPVEKIVERKSTLAHNLVRTQREVWITEPSAAVLGLWMANPGVLSGAVPEWPLLADLDNAQIDWFKSVPVGFDLRGDVVNARFFECNWALGGKMGSGKSTLVITATAGAILDPIVEIDVFVLAPNSDYEPMRPRLRTLVDGTGDDVADAAVDCMQQLYDSIEYRGQALKDKTLNPTGARTLTRGMALKDPRLRPRIVIIDECQRVFADTDKVDKTKKQGRSRGEIATDVAVQLVNTGRKYGITLILLTPEPTANSLPRKLLSVFTHAACGAIGDQTGNDAVLGTGSYRSGISAVGLEPKTDDALNDCGTLMTRGFMSKPGLLRSCYLSPGDLARVTERAMALRNGIAPAAVKAGAETEVRDLLEDVVQVMQDKPRMRSEAVRRFLADEWPQTYGTWSAQRFSAELREAGKSTGLGIRKGRVDGDEGQQHIVLDEVLATLNDRPEQMEDTPEDP
jgi:S-DNA-T family DNA segregation ATPase FtsK/SpoIIIE